MAAKLSVACEAEQDIAEAYEWYENRRFGLGEDFVTTIDACLDAICRTPEMSEIVLRNYRRAVVRRFPYAIFYEYAN